MRRFTISLYHAAYWISKKKELLPERGTAIEHEKEVNSSDFFVTNRMILKSSTEGIYSSKTTKEWLRRKSAKTSFIVGFFVLEDIELRRQWYEASEYLRFLPLIFHLPCLKPPLAPQNKPHVKMKSLCWLEKIENWIQNVFLLIPCPKNSLPENKLLL